jgi:hypothetical protein
VQEEGFPTLKEEASAPTERAERSGGLHKRSGASAGDVCPLWNGFSIRFFYLQVAKIGEKVTTRFAFCYVPSAAPPQDQSSPRLSQRHSSSG